MKAIIENADIVLTGVALSDIYINKDQLLIAGKDIGNSNSQIKEMLNKATGIHLDYGKDIWKTEISNVDVFTQLSKSHSAYRTMSKREYLAVCQLGSIEFEEAMIEKDRLGVLGDLYSKVSEFISYETIAIEDIELRFYEFGNVTISGAFRIRNEALTMEQYQVTSDFAHAMFGPALRERVSQLVSVYAKVMREVDASTEVAIEMLNVPLEIDIDFSKPSIETRSLKYTLDFAIRYHVVYNSNLKDKEDFVEPFFNVLCGEWEMGLKEQLRLKKASIYFGWTHSLVILDDFNNCESLKQYELFRFPLEVVLTNWGALNSLSKRLEKGRATFIKEMDDIERYSFKKKKYNEMAMKIREFSLKVKRILQSLDSYTVTNNPMHYKLIDMQQEVFLEHKSVERINQQIDLVNSLVDELSEREKALSEGRINKVLTILTMLTVVDIARTLYEVSVSGGESLAWVGIISGVMLLLMLIVYKYEPSRKLWGKKKK